MTHFDMLCEVLEQMEPTSFNDILNDKASNVLEGLTDITQDGVDAISIFTDFLMCAVAADGRLTEEEFGLIKPVLDILYGGDVGFGDAQKIFHDAGLHKPEDIKNVMDLMIDIIGQVSPQLKDDIVLLCMMVCAVDGKISDDEREWISELIE